MKKTPQRPPPTERELEQATYHNNLKDIEKSAIRYLPESWQFQMRNNHIVIHSNSSIGVFPKILIKINDSLMIHAAYYGWFSNTGAAIESIDVGKTTLAGIIRTVSNFSVCRGIATETDYDLGNADVIKHQGMLYNSLDEMLAVPPPPSTYLIAQR